MGAKTLRIPPVSDLVAQSTLILAPTTPHWVRLKYRRDQGKEALQKIHGWPCNTEAA